MLVDDPVTILDYGQVLEVATAALDTNPAAAAEGFAQLANEMRHRGFAGRAATLRRSERQALRNAGDQAGAVANTVQALLDAYDDGRGLAIELSELRRPPDQPPADPTNYEPPTLAEVAEPVAAWAENGVDLAEVIPPLQIIVDQGHRLARRLVLTVAEQVVTDEEPRAGLEGLDALIEAVSADDGRDTGQHALVGHRHVEHRGPHGHHVLAVEHAAQ